MRLEALLLLLLLLELLGAKLFLEAVAHPRGPASVQWRSGFGAVAIDELFRRLTLARELR